MGAAGWQRSLVIIARMRSRWTDLHSPLAMNRVGSRRRWRPQDMLLIWSGHSGRLSGTVGRSTRCAQEVPCRDVVQYDFHL
jgi:hypothetical protein